MEPQGARMIVWCILVAQLKGSNAALGRAGMHWTLQKS